MDLMVLDSSFANPKLVERYESLIWTERFYEPGEFSLVTYNIDEARGLLPIDSFVKIDSSPQLSTVEDHLIDKDDDGVKKLTVTGRTLDCIYESRVFPPKGLTSNSLSQIGESIPAYIRLVRLLSVFDTWDYIESYETFPNFNAAYDEASFQNDPFTREGIPKYGPFSDLISNIQRSENIGIQARLPILGETFLGYFPNTKVFMWMYKGVDRTVNQSNIKQVTISNVNGSFDDNNYLFTKKNYKNIAYAFASDKRMNSAAAPNSTGSERTGRTRRALYVDASDIDLTGKTNDVVMSLLANRAATALAKYNRTTYVDGTATAAASYIFNRDYKLGDRVTVLADYGVKETARVTEYTRTKDLTGETEYPTLVIENQEQP